MSRRIGDSNYEQQDGEYCEGDNEDAEDEYHTEEEDQDDEFVTKMSVMS